MKTLVKTNPGRTLTLFNDFDRWFDSIFSGDAVSRNVRTPAVDVREEKDRYVLEAELPGLTEKDIEVKIDDNLLTISAGTESEKEEKKNNYLFRERYNSVFSRSFVLPKDVDVEKVEAVFKNGILSLELRKNETALPKTIEVKTK